MKTDRELVLLAAKAIGRKVDRIAEDAVNFGGLFFEDHDREAYAWNPLVDDGDALRLAANLRLQVKPGKHLGDGCTVETQRDGIAGCTAFYDDPSEQMRYAIARAAAEIGKAMP